LILKNIPLTEPLEDFMKVMTLAVALVVVAILTAWAATGTPAPPKVNDVRTFMLAKLEGSKNVLEGLTTENFDLIVKNSQAMGLLSEDALWQVMQTPEYSQRSADFRRITDRLTEAARKKNLDGAALAYVEMTMSCIECHKYVRDQNRGPHDQSKSGERR
jgi:cytochrome c556